MVLSNEEPTCLPKRLTSSWTLKLAERIDFWLPEVVYLFEAMTTTATWSLEAFFKKGRFVCIVINSASFDGDSSISSNGVCIKFTIDDPACSRSVFGLTGYLSFEGPLLFSLLLLII